MKAIRLNDGLVSGALALGLSVLGGVYLAAKWRQNAAATAGLSRATQQLQRLAQRDPYPSSENIAAARQEGARVQTFLGTMIKHFTPAPAPEVRNSMDLRTYLDIAVARLRNDAARSGVDLPADYWFSFGAHKGTVNFPPPTLHPLAQQLAEVSTLSEVLFEARVNALDWVKRVPVEARDPSASADYLSGTIVTNGWGELVPYELAFRGFSSELASVLDGLRRLPQCFVVTNVAVEAVSSGPLNKQLEPAAFPGAGQLGAWRRWPDRAEPFPPRVPFPMRTPPPVRPGGANTVLSEQLLRVVLSINAVRVNPQAVRLALRTPDSANARPGRALLENALAEIEPVNRPLIPDEIQLAGLVAPE